MDEIIKKIISKEIIYKEVKERKKYYSDDGNIEITIQRDGDKIAMWAFNNEKDKFINLEIKKYKFFIDKFRDIAERIEFEDHTCYIKLLKPGKRKNIIVGYCRVSTKGQLDGNSIDEQKSQILNRYSNADIYIESYSGAKERAIFNEVLNMLQDGDMLVVTKLDRFCRTTKEGLAYIDILLKKNVRIHILNMGLIEDTPMGRLIVTNLLAFAEFERAMIIERTQAGKAIAKTKAGFREGRPNKFNRKQLDNAMSMLSVNGGEYSYNELEELLGISKSTLVREQRKRKL